MADVTGGKIVWNLDAIDSGFSTSITKAEEKVGSLAESIRQAEAKGTGSLGNLSKSSKTASAQISEASKSTADNVAVASKRTTDSVEAIATSTKRTSAATGLNIGGMTKQFLAFGLVFGALNGVKLGIEGIIGGAANFQQSLNVLQSVSGATTSQLAKMSAQAVKLGNDITLPGVSSADAARAMTELAKAGLSVNDVLGASKGVLSLAKAGQLDVADAAQITAEALNAFSLQGKDATKVADLLAAAANSSTSDVNGMALGLEQVGASAKQSKVSLSDTVTALALFSNAGIQGSDAGTSLKQMFIQLATPTKAASDLMNKLGLDFYDAKGNFIGLGATAQLLQTKLAGLTVEQKNNALATIFGSDATRVAGVLADQGAAGFDKMSTAVNKQGAAASLAAAQNSGFNGALDNFKSTVQTLGIEIGTKLLPPLTTFLNLLSNNLPAAIGLVTALGTAFATIRVAAFVDNLGKANSVISTVSGSKNIQGLSALAKGFKAVSLQASLFNQGAQDARVADSAFSGLAGTLGGKFATAVKVVTGSRVSLAATTGGITALGESATAASIAIPPLAIAIAGVAAVVGAGLLVKHLIDARRSTDDLSNASTSASRSLSPFSDQISTVANRSQTAASNMDTATRSVGFLALATQDVTNKQRDANIAQDRLNTLQSMAAGYSQAYAAAQNNFTLAQNAYNAAVAQYGPNSQQAIAASQVLTGAQANLAGAFSNSAGQGLNLQIAEGNLKGATDALAGSTGYLASLTGYFKDQMAGLIGVVSTFGATAFNQIGRVTQLHDSVLSVANLRGSIESLNQSLAGVGNLLQSSNSSAQRLQSVVSGISLQASQTSKSLQASGSKIQGTRASGGPVAAGAMYLTGEVGPELFVPDKNGQIISNDVLTSVANMLSKFTGGNFTMPALQYAPAAANSGKNVVINQKNNNYTNYDLDKAMSDLAWRIRR